MPKHALKLQPKAKPADFLKLDLACGQRLRDGFTGVDLIAQAGVAQVVDLEKPWPWADASCAELHCSHYVEHTPDLIHFMNEAHRVLIVGGTLTVIAPYYTSMRAWQDPTHKRAICEATFLYFNKGWREREKLGHYPITTDFDFTFGYEVAPEWVSRSEEARAFAIRSYFNVVNDLHCTLTKRAPQA